jgi:hypothetical protein
LQRRAPWADRRDGAAAKSFTAAPGKTLSVVYLVDTNIISVGAPTKAVPMTEFIKWMDEHSTKLYASVVNGGRDRGTSMKKHETPHAPQGEDQCSETPNIPGADHRRRSRLRNNGAR